MTATRLLAPAGLAALTAFSAALPAAAQDMTDVSIGLSGWTGFAPLTLAKETGIFEKHGLNVTLTKIPQASRGLALASGDIQCAATTVETWLIWDANNVKATQIFQLDKSHGADGMVVRNDIATIADLKGKTVAASAPGTSPYFYLNWILAKNGMSIDDVTVVNLEPGPAAQAFIAGQNDAAMTYEPYLSSVREAKDAGKIIATTLDYPAVMDTFGCTPDFLSDHPEAAKAIAASYADALAMIASDKDKAFGIMGADVNQTAEQFGASAGYLEWQSLDAAKTFFADEYVTFATEAADLLVKTGLIQTAPDVSTLVDTQYLD
ncbi:ABC transporter substrate-binding protein [Frigidibacter sp. MR17.24]|uniref:ABC transporter substrate-binding protein n=1 Tax=Frigidibacter sp. MR17.24 TaxID=3127345 RepID=UPI003012ADB7